MWQEFFFNSTMSNKVPLSTHDGYLKSVFPNTSTVKAVHAVDAGSRPCIDSYSTGLMQQIPP